LNEQWYPYILRWHTHLYHHIQLWHLFTWSPHTQKIQKKILSHSLSSVSFLHHLFSLFSSPIPNSNNLHLQQFQSSSSSFSHHHLNQKMIETTTIFIFNNSKFILIYPEKFIKPIILSNPILSLILSDLLHCFQNRIIIIINNSLDFLIFKESNSSTSSLTKMKSTSLNSLNLCLSYKLENTNVFFNRFRDQHKLDINLRSICFVVVAKFQNRIWFWIAVKRWNLGFVMNMGHIEFFFFVFLLLKEIVVEGGSDGGGNVMAFVLQTVKYMVVREICFVFRERKEKRTMKKKMVKCLKYPCHIRGVHKWYRKKWSTNIFPIWIHTFAKWDYMSNLVIKESWYNVQHKEKLMW